MKPNLKIYDEEIKSYLLEHEKIFIQVIDTLWYRPAEKPAATGEDVQFYEERTGNKISSLIAVKNNQVYLRITDSLIPEAVKILDSYSHFFSIYGEKKIVDSISGKLRLKKRSQVDYYVMRIDLEKTVFSGLEYEGFYCSPADETHFDLLKKLQHYYNIEEVYKGEFFYPYKLEMKSFKEKLRIRENFAVFTDEPHTKAVSKIYTNAESSDAYQIGGVYTLKKYRKKGFSFFCLVHLLNHALRQKKRYVYLFVNKSNIPAISLYKKAGFSIEAETVIAYY